MPRIINIYKQLFWCLLVFCTVVNKRRHVNATVAMVMTEYANNIYARVVNVCTNYLCVLLNVQLATHLHLCLPLYPTAERGRQKAGSL